MEGSSKRRKVGAAGAGDDAAHTDAVSQWRLEEEAAEAMVPILGRLYRNSSIYVSVFGQRLNNLSAIELIQVHSEAQDEKGRPILVTDTKPLVDALEQMADLPPMRVDVGMYQRLLSAPSSPRAASPRAASPAGAAAADNGAARLEKMIRADHAQTGTSKELMTEATNVVLYGFGRIGRLLTRLLVEKTGGGNKMLLRAIVVRQKGKPGSDLDKRASLLGLDSVHGRFNGRISVDRERNAIIANGCLIRILYANAPDELDYEQYGIRNAVVVDNTGIHKDRQSLSRHLSSKGISKVIVSAPAKGIPNIVFGVNDHLVDDKGERVFSAASCTTNATVPLLKLLMDRFGVEHGHIETVHSVTNDQNLTDNFHPKERRGRAASLNLVLTETGAAVAAVKCLPEYQGKLTASAIRVPTPNVSLAIVILTLSVATTLKALNSFLRENATRGPLQVSTDFNGSRAACVVDSANTIVSADGKRVNVYAWYDNEFGYSTQLYRLLSKVCGVVLPRVPP